MGSHLDMSLDTCVYAAIRFILSVYTFGSGLSMREDMDDEFFLGALAKAEIFFLTEPSPSDDRYGMEMSDKESSRPPLSLSRFAEAIEV